MKLRRAVSKLLLGDEIFGRIGNVETRVDELRKELSSFRDELREGIGLEVTENIERALFEREDRAAAETKDVRHELEELVHYKFDHFNDRFSKLQDEIRATNTEMRSNFVIGSMGLSSERVKQTRYIPIRVYLSEDDPQSVHLVRKAVGSFARELGFTPASELPAESGSWFQKWFGKSKDVMTSQEVKDTLTKGRRAVEVATLHKKQAEVNRDHAEAASAFIKAVENTPNAVAQFGSLLIVKLSDAEGKCSIFTRDLSVREMEYIENNPEVTKSPNLVLEKLAHMKIDAETQLSIEHEGAEDE